MSTDKVVLVTGSVGVEYTCSQTNTWIPTIGGVNSQTVGYTPVLQDNGKAVVMNGANLTLTLPSPPFSNTWAIFVSNINPSNLTISRNGLTIDGAASNINIIQFQGMWITTDGTNYFTQRGVSGFSTPVINALTFGVRDDTKFIPDGQVTIGQNTIGCANTNDCNFTAADNGKICFGLNGQSTSMAVNLPQGTLTVTGAQSATCSGGNATATNTTTETIFWGSDDTTALQATTAAYAALPCSSSVVFPAGLMLVQKGLFNAAPASPCATTATAAYAANGVNFTGQGLGTTFFVGTPNFDFTNTSCPTNSHASITACFFNFSNVGVVSNLGIWGGGNSLSAVNLANIGIIGDSEDTHLNFITVIGWGAASNGLIGVLVGGGSGNYVSGDQLINQVVVDGGGSINFRFTAENNAGCFNCVSSTSGTSIIIDANASAQFFGGFNTCNNLGNCVRVFGVGSFYSTNSNPATSTLFDVETGGRLNIIGGNLNGLTSCLRVGQNGTAYVSGVTCSSSSSSVIVAANGTFIDGGGNTFSNGLQSTKVLASVQGAGVGSGTSATASITTPPSGQRIIVYTIFGPAGNTSTGCTDTYLDSYTQVGSTQTTTTTNGTAVQMSVYTTNLAPSAANTLANNTITCTYTSSVSAPGAVVGAIAVDSSDIIQFENGNGANGSGATTSVTSGAATNTFPNELLVVVGGQNVVSTSFTPGAGFTNQTAGATFLFAESQLIAAPGTATTPTGTTHTAGDWVSKTLAIRPNYSGLTAQPSIGVSPLLTSNFSTPSGTGAGQWGSGPATTSCTGSIGGGRIGQCIITVGTGTIGSNPVLTVTFPQTFFMPPNCVATQVGGTQSITSFATGTGANATTTTTATFTYQTTPSASNTIITQINCQ